MLLAAVHVKIKLGDNTLEYEENFSCKQETSDKKLANRSPYFTALQYINNIETQTSPKTTFNFIGKNLNFFQKNHPAV